MRKWVLVLAFVIMLWPGAVSAQSVEDIDDETAVIHINADVTIAAGESIDNLVVISGNAIIEGTVEGTLVVIDGDATISGSVGDDVTVISGDVTLLDGATVDNVHVIRGDVEQAPGVTVMGDIDESDLSGIWAAVGVFSVLLWVGLTIAAIVAGVIFALIGGRQLTAAARIMTDEAVSAIVGAVFVVIALPIIAVVLMITVIGLPLGLGTLLFLLPALLFLGHLVAAVRLGMLVTGALKHPSSGRPILAVVVGVLLLQLILIIPALGAVVVLLASIWGAGSLVALAFQAMRGSREEAESPPAAVA